MARIHTDNRQYAQGARHFSAFSVGSGPTFALQADTSPPLVTHAQRGTPVPRKRARGGRWIFGSDLTLEHRQTWFPRG